jgi:hypothetical protein
MATVESPGIQQLPAVHPKLATYIDTAAACLQAWARANGQNWATLTDPDALLLQTLLAKSKPEGNRSVVPILPLSDFKGLLNEPLTERRWEKFLRWFSREIRSDLAKTCAERDEPMLYPARSSKGIGGRGTKGQAIYFLSFEAPPQLGKTRPADSPAPESVERQNQQPGPSPTSAKGEGSSPDANEPSAQGEEGNLGGKSKSRDQASRPERTREPLDQDVPLAVFLGLHSGTPGGVSIGWIVALALILVIATSSAEPASMPLADEMVRILSAAREALSGAVIVRF